MTNDFKKELIGIAETLDETGNVILGPEEGIPLAGNPHATMSQRWGQEEIMGNSEQKKVGKWWDRVLTWIENKIFRIPTRSHCQDAIKDFPTDLPSSG